jgi:uncharacterized membrane protein YhaH (DUF805 family)
MTKIYPNLTVTEHGKLMRLAFWLFSMTLMTLVIVLLGIQSGFIPRESSPLISAIIGPILATNVGLLCYLADRDWNSHKPDTKS